MAETCQIALQRLKWIKEESGNQTCLSQSRYASIDPAPPSNEVDIEELKRTMMDEKKSLFERYRAMFSLRNLGTTESINSLAEGEVWYFNNTDIIKQKLVCICLLLLYKSHHNYTEPILAEIVPRVRVK